MARPRVALDNADVVYDYYECHEQSRVYARTMHALLARVYRADITTDAGAQDAIKAALESDARLVISPNHTTADDQYIIVSLAQRLRVLRPLRGATFIPSEPSLVTRSGMAGRLLRRGVDGLGAIPTFRLEDLRRQGVELTDEIRQRHQASIERCSDTHVRKLVDGQCMAGFWEGTRNRVDYRVVQPLKKGIAHTAVAAAAHVPVQVVPIGIYYGAEPEDYRHPVLPDRHRPLVHVGMPLPVQTTSVDELTDLVHPAIQHCVDETVARQARRDAATAPRSGLDGR